MTAKKPRIEFRSRGAGGNIFAILGDVRAALRKQHRITEYNDLFEAVNKSGGYTEALALIREKIDLVDLDGQY